MMNKKQIQLLDYLCDLYKKNKPIPTLNKLSQELGISVASLREQIEIPKALGIVSSTPRNGNVFREYSFTPAVSLGVSYAVKINRDYFWQFAQLRRVIEEAFFIDAVQLLTSEDIAELKLVISTAKVKLTKKPIEIPHDEHRQFHLKIFSRLENTFVNGLLEGFWTLYEMFGLNVYSDIEYLQKVWDLHEKIVKSIAEKDFSKGQFWLIAHMGMISQR